LTIATIQFFKPN